MKSLTCFANIDSAIKSLDIYHEIIKKTCKVEK